VNHQIVVSGFHGLWHAYRNPAIHHALNGAELWIPDGIAPLWIARLQRLPGARSLRRTPGAEVMKAFFELANRKGYSSYFYGDSTATLVRLVAEVEARYPGHRVAGYESPPFRELTSEETEAVLARINDSGADVLWVALGTPRQDCWIAQHRQQLLVPVAAGVGAAFAFLSGHVQRCPPWMGRLGLEWAYRLVREPRKLWRRVVVEGLGFLVACCFEGCGLLGRHRSVATSQGMLPCLPGRR
jgi:N-acetylglucosaminyldiphosphoundecaprenol N-acetyl-beta-D-mannosaminyltransferase